MNPPKFCKQLLLVNHFQIKRMRVLLITAFLILSYGCLHGEWFEEARVCICNQCYSGKNCSTLISNCTIQMNHQQCTLCREWWKKQKEKVIINLDFQLKYQEYPDQSGIGPLLIETIKEGKFERSNRST